MLGSLQGEGHAGERAELAAPHAGRDHHGLGLDRAVVGLDPGHGAVRGREAGDGHALDDLRARRPARPSRRPASTSAGFARPSSGTQAAARMSSTFAAGQCRPTSSGPTISTGTPWALREDRLTGDGLEPLGCAREVQVADRPEPGVLPGLRGEGRQQLGGVARHPQEGLRRHAGAGDQAGRVPRGAGGELFALEQHDVSDAQLRSGDRRCCVPIAPPPITTTWARAGSTSVMVPPGRPGGARGHASGRPLRADSSRDTSRRGRTVVPAALRPSPYRAAGSHPCRPPIASCPGCLADGLDLVTVEVRCAVVHRLDQERGAVGDLPRSRGSSTTRGSTSPARTAAAKAGW